MNRLLHDVMRLAGQLPERDQRYIAGEVMRIITGLDGPSWAERVRQATPEPPKDLDTAIEEMIQSLSPAPGIVTRMGGDAESGSVARERDRARSPAPKRGRGAQKIAIRK